MNLIFKNYIYLDNKESVDILNLRNEDFVREQMTNSDPISIDDHKNFINILKSDNNKQYYAVYNNNSLIGSLNVVYKDELFWGLYFKDISSMQKSISTYIFLDYIFNNFNHTLHAYVKKNNEKALKFNIGFGFKIYSQDGKYYYLAQNKNNWQNNNQTELLKSFRKYLNRVQYSFIK